MPVDDHLLGSPATKRAVRAASAVPVASVAPVVPVSPVVPVASVAPVVPVSPVVPVASVAPVVPVSPVVPATPVASARKKRLHRADAAEKAVKPKVPKGEETAIRELRFEVRNLTESISELMHVFRKAHEDIKEEPYVDLAPKLDRIIEQNHEIGRVLLLLLELHREHIPKIAKHTRISNELKLRWPPAKIFSEQLR